MNPTPKVEVHYTSGPSSRNPVKGMVDALLELWVYREMTWILFCRDLKASFRGSFLGYVWLFLPPAATTLVWFLLNQSRVVAFDDPEIPYPLFVLVGTILWSSFTRATVLPLQIFQLSKPVFSKIKVPVGAFLLVAPLRAAFDSLLHVLVAAAVFGAFDVGLQATLLLVPLSILSAVILGFAFSLLLLPMSALYADVQQGLVLVLSVAIYLAPVVYPAPESGLAATIVGLNPVTPIITSAREWVFDGEATGIGEVLMVSGGSFLVAIMILAAMRTAMPHLTARMGM
jgi:lipopolysaccharide transport system permease protein